MNAYISIFNINNGIKEPTCGYQICITNQIILVSVYAKVRESLYTQVVVWFSMILKHIDTRLVNISK